MAISNLAFNFMVKRGNTLAKSLLCTKPSSIVNPKGLKFAPALEKDTVQFGSRALDEINTKAVYILTDKNALILVYCRTGRRSKNAANNLAKLGYTNVKEFGGINDWKYGTVTE